MRIRKVGLWLLSITASALFMGGTIFAVQMFESGSTVSVPGGGVTDSMLFRSGNNVVIDGVVKGNVYCAGQTVEIRAEVEGDVYCAGQNLTLNGKIHGNAHLAGQTITIGGLVDRDVTVGGQSVLVQEQARIGRDLLGGAQSLTIEGKVARDAVMGSESSRVNGSIGRDVRGEINTLTLGTSGIINGKAEYVSANDPVIEQGGKISGGVYRTMPEEATVSRPSFFASWIAGFFYMLIAGIVVSLGLVLLFPRMFHQSANETTKKPGYTLLAGFVAAMALPILIVLFMVTVIGIPFGIILITAGILLAMLSTPFAAYLTGHLVVGRSDVRRKPLLVMLIGITIVTVVYAIPVLGLIAMVAAYFMGAGMIVRGILLRTPRPRYVLQSRK